VVRGRGKGRTQKYKCAPRRGKRATPFDRREKVDLKTTSLARRIASLLAPGERGERGKGHGTGGRGEKVFAAGRKKGAGSSSTAQESPIR